MPYLTLGFPSPAISVEICLSLAENGADMIELGLPFSDPLADGPVIQRSTQQALDQGVTPASFLEMARTLRERGVTIPFLMMGYYNPLLAYGLADFVRDSVEAGIDGFIIPDLPVEESVELQNLCRDSGQALVFLASPNTPRERLGKLGNQSMGFLYLVSLIGVTGERAQLPPALSEFIARVRQVVRLPLAVGFGISTPDHAQQVARIADGVIVGSALIRLIAGALHPVEVSAKFIRELKQAVKRE
jgi:tryptophan synthase alpha chain